MSKKFHTLSNTYLEFICPESGIVTIPISDLVTVGTPIDEFGNDLYLDTEFLLDSEGNKITTKRKRDGKPLLRK